MAAEVAVRTLLCALVTDLLGEVAVLEDRPVVGHPADLLARALEERALLRGEVGVGLVQEAVPVGLAAEQLTLHPDRSGLDGSALGLGDGRQEAELVHRAHDWPCQYAAADRWYLRYEGNGTGRSSRDERLRQRIHDRFSLLLTV